MFFKKDKSSNGGLFGPIFGLFRVFLSLVILGVLILGIYQAYKSFAGVDPLTANPRSIIQNILASEDAYELLTSILAADPEGTLGKAKEVLGNDIPGVVSDSSDNIVPSNAVLKYRFAIISDPHTDSENLNKALQMAKDNGAKFVIGLGDYSDVGTLDELRNIKLRFDTVNLTFYSTAGDHDLWDSRNRNLPAAKNYTEIFGSPYSSFGYENTRFIILYNSDNYFGVDEVQLKWFEDELQRASSGGFNQIFVMTAIPLYHPSSDHVMGKTEDKLKVQAEHLISLFDQAGVNEVFAGDTHFYSRYTEPKTGLKMTSVGAVTGVRNAQAPRFVMVDIFEDGGYNVEDLEIQ